MIIQLLIIGVALLLLARVFNQYRRRKVAWTWFLLWSIFTAGVIVIALIPSITDQAAHLVGVGRGADLVIYCSLALLFWAVLRLTIRADQQQREMTELVRKIAIDRAEKPEEK